MRVVGIRELKDRLSEYLRLVKAGETILVTDRGKVVAQLGAPGSTGRVEPQLPPGIAQLPREGRLRPGAPGPKRPYPRLPPLLTLEQVLGGLDEDREERC